MVKLYREEWDERDMLTNFDTTVVEIEKAGTWAQPFPHLVALVIAATRVSVRELMSRSKTEIWIRVMVGRVVKSWICSSWYSNFLWPTLVFSQQIKIILFSLSADSETQSDLNYVVKIFSLLQKPPVSQKSLVLPVSYYCGDCSNTLKTKMKATKLPFMWWRK